jgi:poly(3-hydroxybutyrate) depolymerase
MGRDRDGKTSKPGYRRIVCLNLLLVHIGCAGALQQALERAVTIKEGLLLDGVGRYGPQVVYSDPVVAQIVQDRWLPPKEGEVITDEDGKEHTWQKVVVDGEGWFVQPGRSGYLYLSITSDRQRPVLLNVQGAEMLYINGWPYIGSRYASKERYESWETNFNITYLPVMLRIGRNDLLLHRAWRSRGRAKVMVMETPQLLINPLDATLPDLVAGMDVNTVGAIVIINASQQPQTDLSLQVTWPSGQRNRSPIPRIEGLSFRKVGFELGHVRLDRAGPVTCRVELMRGVEVLDQVDMTLQVKEKDQPLMQTFVSDIDGSVQYYAIRHACTWPISSPLPALVLSLHGAGVQALGQAAAYAPKSWCHIVCPTNRRPYGFDWEDWGRLDLLEVIGQVSRTLRFDPTRVYLTGHSMGGHGTWILGCTYPDKFGAIGPSAGWISLGSYRRTGPPQPSGPVSEILSLAENTSNTIGLADNLWAMGIYILHGGADDVVRPQQARLMIDQLTKSHHDWVYHEQPGAGHWWDLSDKQEGADCVDWPAMFDFFAR